GVAPDADLVSLRVLDANGNGTVKNVVGAVDWLLKNGSKHHVGVVNISGGAPQATSYHKDILSALVESLWFDGMAVVVAAGNGGPNAGTLTPPGSDPCVITVGLELSDEECHDQLVKLVDDAAAQGTFVRLDMEDSFTTDKTLDRYEKLRDEGRDNVGVVLQAMLRRTVGDAERLAARTAHVR